MISPLNSVKEIGLLFLNEFPEVVMIKLMMVNLPHHTLTEFINYSISNYYFKNTMFTERLIFKKIGSVVSYNILNFF